jgi:hypothetical protein
MVRAVFGTAWQLTIGISRGALNLNTIIPSQRPSEAGGNHGSRQ